MTTLSEQSHKLTLTEQATSVLREAIISHTLAPGTNLQEKSACELTGASRTPVRVAMATLAKEGMLEYLPQRGYRVREFSLESVAQGFEIRATLEGMAARLAAEHGLSDQHLAILQKCVEDGNVMLEASSQELDRISWREMNETYHRTIQAAANYPLLSDLILRTENVPFNPLNVIPHWQGERSDEMVRFSHFDHIYILDAIINRQGGRAEARMREHIMVAIDVMRDQVAATLDHR